MPIINRTPYRNLILTGHTGSGKTAAGREVARRMNAQFYDLDNEITLREGNPPEVIRELLGEVHLHSIENQMIQELTIVRSTVIAVNNTTLLKADNMEKITATGPILCLSAALNELLRRLHVARGARFHSPQTRSELLGKLRRERPLLDYNLPALDTTRLQVSEVVEKTIQFWLENADT